MIRDLKFAVLLFCFIGLFHSCGPSTPHEIVLEQDGMLIVNLKSKVEPANLREIAWYYYDDHKMQDGGFMINFCIPSEYPDYPETPWATAGIYAYDNTGEKESISLRISGTKNDQEKNNLKQINPDVHRILGKWYFNEPMLESVYVLVEQSTDTLMLIFWADDYVEYNGEQVIEFTESSKKYDPRKQADLVDHLTHGLKSNEYCIDTFPEPSYLINDQNQLILLDRIKSYNDTTHPVLEPIPFEP